MDNKNIKIFISVGLILASLAVAYFLDYSKWKDIKTAEGEIKQTTDSITAKKNYYAVIDTKMAALSSAGWSNKKDSIAINFTSSPFFIPKITTFFKTIVTSNGLTLTGITASSPSYVKPQVQTTTETTSGKISKVTSDTATQQTTIPTSSSYGGLQGAIKKTPLNLSITGTYAAFKNLLLALEGQTRIVTVNSVSVSPAGTTETTGTGRAAVSRNVSSFSVTVDIYSY